MVQYLYFRVLKFRLNLDETEVLEGREGRIVRHQVPEQTDDGWGVPPFNFPGCGNLQSLWTPTFKKSKAFGHPVRAVWARSQLHLEIAYHLQKHHSLLPIGCFGARTDGRTASENVDFNLEDDDSSALRKWVTEERYNLPFFGQQLSCGVSRHKTINLPQHHRGQRGWVMLHAHFQSRTTNLALGALGALGVAVLHPCELLGLNYIAHSGTQFLLASLREITCEEKEWNTRSFDLMCLIYLLEQHFYWHPSSPSTTQRIAKTNLRGPGSQWPGKEEAKLFPIPYPTAEPNKWDLPGRLNALFIRPYPGL